MTIELLERNRLFYYASILVAFVLPFNSTMVVSYSLVLLSISWLLYENLGARLLSLKRNRFFMLFAGLYFLYLIGLIYSQDLDNGIKQVEVTFSLLLMPLIFGSMPALKPRQLKIILISFFAGNLVVGIILLAFNINKLIILSRPLSHLFYYDIYYSFTDFIGIHSVYYSMYLSFCIALIIIYLSQNRRKSNIVNALLVSAASFLLFLILIMASRMQIAILFLIINIIIIWIFKNKFKAVLTVLILNVLIVSIIINMRFTYYQYIKLIETELESSNKSTGNKRLPRWIASIDIIKANFLFGVGTGDATEELVAVYDIYNLKYASEKRYNAHNQYLEIFIILGFIGLLYFLATLIYPLIIGVSANQKAYVLFLIIILFSFSTESMLNRQQGVVFYAYFNSLLAFNLLANKLNG